MSTATTLTIPKTLLPTHWTLADLQQHLGGIPLERIRLYPPPGMATEQDALDIDDRGDRLCELVDGVLVEKVMGSYESLLAGFLIQMLNNFLDDNPLGIVLASDGALKILPTKMRIPDVSFIRWEKFPGRKVPRTRVFAVAPDLAVEILSKGNTEAEMKQKLAEYIEAGVRLVWYIDPEARKTTVYRSNEGGEEIGDDDGLSGGDVLPGYEFRLRDLLDRVQRADT